MDLQAKDSGEGAIDASRKAISWSYPRSAHPRADCWHSCCTLQLNASVACVQNKLEHGELVAVLEVGECYLCDCKFLLGRNGIVEGPLSADQADCTHPPPSNATQRDDHENEYQ